MKKPDAAKVFGLTSRETELSRLLCTGKSRKLAAAELGITVRTVDKYLANLRAKTSTASLFELLCCLCHFYGTKVFSTRAGLTAR